MERLKYRSTGWVRRILLLLIGLRKVGWRRVARRWRRRAAVVVWMWPDASLGSARSYLGGNDFLNDLALLDATASAGQSFEIVIGPAIGPRSGRLILYTISHRFNGFSLADHARPMVDVLRALVEQGNRVMPPVREAMLWENKAYMHEVFERESIRTPETQIVRRESWNADRKEIAAAVFPSLLKEVHSAGSAGVTLVGDVQALELAVEERFAAGQSEILVQRLLSMRRDLRVVIVDGTIVLHYWRVNTAVDWQPTSTSHGSKVDFVSFPEQWRAWMLEVFRRLDVTSGAFDIAWDGDDLESEPYVLEVSPAFMPNPPQPPQFDTLTYAQYKRVLRPKPQYLLDYVALVHALKRQAVRAYLKAGRE